MCNIKTIIVGTDVPGGPWALNYIFGIVQKV